VSKYVQVKNFERFQHYKDRDPPWIKLYVRILDDYTFSKLPDAHKAHLALIWVLASKTENKIPADSAWISNRIGATEPVNLNALLEAGFLEPWEEKRAKGKREEWSSRYVSAETRTALLSAAQHKCAACPSTEHLEIDHIIPISRGGSSEPDNLQVLCRKCNRRKRVQLSHETAEHVRSAPLRRTTDQRSPETETEERQSQNTMATPSGEARQGGLTRGQLLGLIRKCTAPRNGKTSEADMTTNASVVDTIAGRGWTYARIGHAVIGTQMRRDRGEIGCIPAGSGWTLKYLLDATPDVDPLQVGLNAYHEASKPPPDEKRKGSTATIGDVLDFTKFAKGA